MRPKIPLRLARRFRRVCPTWAKHIMDDPYDYDAPSLAFRDADGNLWSLIQPSYCVVGEAHDRHADHGSELPTYGCRICTRFSHLLASMLDPDWPTDLHTFLDHYEKEHIRAVVA